jgi:protein associated with RNAse G/E
MENIDIISYKHDGELHRVWKNVVKIYDTKELAILINNEVEVIDGDGRKWKTREPAVCYFYKKYWFNVISMIRNDKIYYYCNLSSPFVIDNEGLKYIDYDLDIKVFPDGEILELDRDEYDFNIKYLHYSEKIIKIIEKNLNILSNLIQNREDPFNEASVYSWYKMFLETSKKELEIE